MNNTSSTATNRNNINKATNTPSMAMNSTAMDYIKNTDMNSTVTNNTTDKHNVTYV
jgi:hypothetical protein